MSDTDTYTYADEGLRALILTANDAILGPLGEANVGEYPGPDLTNKLPYVGIEVIDGGADRFGYQLVVDVDVFAGSREKAKSVAAAIALLILRYPRTVEVADGRFFTIDDASCIRFPVKLPWDDTQIKRQSATYQLSVRR